MVVLAGDRVVGQDDKLVVDDLHREHISAGDQVFSELWQPQPFAQVIEDRGVVPDLDDARSVDTGDPGILEDLVVDLAPAGRPVRTTAAGTTAPRTGRLAVGLPDWG